MKAPTVEGLGVGIDAGGTRTRWALTDASGRLLAEGGVDGLTALLMGHEAGRAQVAATLQQLGAQVAQACAGAPAAPPAGRPQRVLAGFTGYSEDAPLRAALQSLVAQALGLPAAQVGIVGDITLAYLDCFAPGDGFLVYAGTGSIAAYIDAGGTMHRAGGRGTVLDDGGSGHWIARQAMRHVWRCEDERPGSWRTSKLAVALFAQIGGSEWNRSRDYIYQGSRGQVGALAVAVAAAATQGDPTALEIMREAGVELARLARALAQRFGPRPVALAGGASRLHPAILASMRAVLGAGTEVRPSELQAHASAARLAARDDPLLRRLGEAEE